jgi:hypothetical protein
MNLTQTLKSSDILKGYIKTKSDPINSSLLKKPLYSAFETILGDFKSMAETFPDHMEMKVTDTDFYFFILDTLRFLQDMERFSPQFTPTQLDSAIRVGVIISESVTWGITE